MNEIGGEIIRKIMAGENIERKKCPVCGNTLRAVIFGYPDEELEMIVQQNSDIITLGGCCCFGDDRDPQYECSKCGVCLTRDLEEIILIYCPLVGCEIWKNECRNYSVMIDKHC